MRWERNEDKLRLFTALPRASLLLSRYRGGKKGIRNVNYVKTHASPRVLLGLPRATTSKI